jgi:hypothetical protein
MKNAEEIKEARAKRFELLADEYITDNKKCLEESLIRDSFVACSFNVNFETGINVELLKAVQAKLINLGYTVRFESNTLFINLFGKDQSR